MGSTGDSYDSALAEALNSLYKAELIDNEARPGYAGPWRDRREVEHETAAWVHWYNTRRPHLALGGITPQQAENQHTTTRKEAASTSLHKTRDLTARILATLSTDTYLENAWQQAAQNHQATAIIPGWGDAICFNEPHHTTPYHNTWD